jgi:hypothetical protein
MNRLAFVSVATLAISLVHVTTPLAEPAPQPGLTEKAPAKKSKAKEKAAQPRIEGAHSSEALARKACADGTVVWVNRRSKIYHAGGTRDYGKTRQGFYMCEAQADRSGFRPVKGPAQQSKKEGRKKALHHSTDNADRRAVKRAMQREPK